MVREKIKTKIARATVHLIKREGQGVLVDGNLILTAAHCINFKIDGSMVLGDYFIEKIKTVKGELSVTPLAVEPVNDIAILCSLDNQTFYNEADEYELFCEETNPVKICTKEFKLFDKFPVYIYTHKGTWVRGDAQQCYKDATHLLIEAEKEIEGGTSGSAVINESGELIGIVSNVSMVKGNKQINDVVVTRPHVTIPVFVYNIIFRKEKLTDIK